MLNVRRPVPRWIPPFLCLLLALPPAAVAQGGPSPAAAQPALIRSLRVIALAGNQEMNDLENRVMADLVVQVLDQTDQPVEGADVVFRFPPEGPSAAFAGQNLAQTFRTNADGQVAATGWTANGKVGSFKVQVTATRGVEQGSAVITMTNVTRITNANKKAGEKHWWSTTWGKVAIGAGAAAVIAAVILLTHGSSSSRTITAVPGPPSVGAPQ